MPSARALLEAHSAAETGKKSRLRFKAIYKPASAFYFTPLHFINLASTIQPRPNFTGLCAFYWQSRKKDSTGQPATPPHRMRKIPSAQDKTVQSSQAPSRSVPFCFCCPVQLTHSKNRKVKSNLTRYYIYISICNVPMYHYF